MSLSIGQIFVCYNFITVASPGSRQYRDHAERKVTRGSRDYGSLNPSRVSTAPMTLKSPKIRDLGIVFARYRSGRPPRAKQLSQRTFFASSRVARLGPRARCFPPQFSIASGCPEGSCE